MIECIYFLSQIQNDIAHMHSAAVRIFTPYVLRYYIYYSSIWNIRNAHVN